MSGDAQNDKKKLAEERQARLSQALRQNLKRRKEQSRERTSETDAEAEVNPGS